MTDTPDEAADVAVADGSALPAYPAQWMIVETPRPLVPAFDATIAVRHDMLAVIGGFSSSLESSLLIQMLHPIRGWLPIGSQLREARARHTMTELGDGRVLIAGGVQGTVGSELVPVLECEVLDPLKADSTLIDPLDEPLLGHTAHALGEGRAVIVGGSSARIFDVASMSFTHAIPLHHARRDHASVLLEEQRLLIIGGDEAGSIEEIDLTAPDTAVSILWEQTLPAPLRELRAIAMPGDGDGDVFICGGVDARTRSSVDSSLIITLGASEAERAIVAGPRLRIERGICAAELFSVQGLIVVLGGEWVSPDDRGAANAVRVYEPGRAKLWRIDPIPDDASRRNWYRTAGGEIAVMGGYRFISPEVAAQTGERPGVHLPWKGYTLKISRVRVFTD